MNKKIEVGYPNGVTIVQEILETWKGQPYMGPRRKVVTNSYRRVRTLSVRFDWPEIAPALRKSWERTVGKEYTEVLRPVTYGERREWVVTDERKVPAPG